MMQNWIFSLQCHLILQKSFSYADLVIKKHVLLLLMLKTVVPLNIFVKKYFSKKYFFLDISPLLYDE